MVRLKGHFDGRQIVLDDSVPDGIREGASVDVVFVDAETKSADGCGSFLECLDALTGSIEGPGDLSEEHDHYAHGAPKRADRND